MRPEAELGALLDAVHQALQQGAFVELATLTSRVERALAGFDPTRDGAELERLRAKAERNARCLLAAGRGLRSARARLKEIAVAGQGLPTSDRAGRRSGFGGTGALGSRF